MKALQNELEQAAREMEQLIKESLQLQRRIAGCIAEQRRIAGDYVEYPFEMSIDDYDPDGDLYAEVLEASERGML
tara:strand:- start:1306 stop:1530 length:225 start_codon:yes stop_codon:yes gene_type:complete